jgi:4-hydroxy-tetrahydrodipicolinate synthase
MPTERGVCAVTVTPFDRTGRLDPPYVTRLATHIACGGTDTITVGGSVGEYMSLSPDEALETLSGTIVAVGGKVPVLAATGLDLRSAVDRAQVAVAAGAAGVMIHQPQHRFRSSDGWIAYNREIADALAPTPIVLYVSDPAVGPRELIAAAYAKSNQRPPKRRARGVSRYPCGKSRASAAR